MRQRREVWGRLSKETKDFVLSYLKNNLKLTKNEFDNFLFPDFEKTLLDGRAMEGMGKAVDRILYSIIKNERVCVYGDYDCDGVPGTALIRDFFEKINYHNVIYYIPHRHTEGYGLNKKAIEKIFHGDLKEEIKDGELVLEENLDSAKSFEKLSDAISKEKTKLLITIDLGTTNIEEIDFANELGIDTIVTDHHLPLETNDGQILPKAYAIINNKKIACNYANKDLCGSGTIFKLVVEILKSLREIERGEKISDRRDKALSSSARRDDIFSPQDVFSSLVSKYSWRDFEKVGLKLPQTGYEKWLLDLVAIATIADMVPLVSENRTLVIYGLYVLSKTNRAGLQTLFKNAKTDLQKVNETDIAFTIAPRINSASRMAHPKIALSMFSQNLKEGIDAAHELEELNNTRKETTKNITKKIYKILDERLEKSSEKKLPEVVVIGDSEWNAGVLGILASKILEKYNVNVFVFGGGEEKGELTFKGSCRSRGDVHLVKLMTAVKEKFLHFGGHELAGGFTINFENLHDLESELNKNILHATIENMVQQKKDGQKNNLIEINLENITPDFFEGLKLIGPFGVGNPKPVFKIKNILRNDIIRFGKSKEHFKMKLVGKNIFDKKIEMEAIKFFVEKQEEEMILELYKNQEIFFEIEAGWNSIYPRLKIIF